MALLAFDLDGTLVQTGARVDYENAATFESHCIAFKTAWARVALAFAQGHQIMFLTGRGEHLLDVTRRQVARWGGYVLAAEATVVVRVSRVFSWDAYVVEKAGALERHLPVIYVESQVRRNEP